MNTHDYLIKWGFTSENIPYEDGSIQYFTSPTGVDAYVFLKEGEIDSVEIEGVNLPNCNALPMLFTVLYAYGIIYDR